MPPNERTRRAIDLLRQLIDTAVRELGALDGLPLGKRAETLVRAFMARAFDAGFQYGKDVDRDKETEPPPPAGPV